MSSDGNGASNHPGDREIGGGDAATFQTAGEILLEMSAFQHQLGTLFGEFLDRTNSARLEMLLNLVAKRAHACERDLAEYVAGMPADLKETRVQSHMHHTPKSLLGDLCDVEQPTSDDVTRVGLESDQYFEDVFRELIGIADANGTERLKDVFENLWQLELEARKSFVRQVNALQDI